MTSLIKKLSGFYIASWVIASVFFAGIILGSVSTYYAVYEAMPPLVRGLM